MAPLPDHEIEGVLMLAADLRALVGTLRRRLREQAHDQDLIPSQVSALVRLGREGPASVTALARAGGGRPQSMGVTVSALEHDSRKWIPVSAIML